MLKRCQKVFENKKRCASRCLPGEKYCEKHKQPFKYQARAIGKPVFEGNRTSDTYQKYINSDQWKQRATRERAFWKNHCVLCHRSFKVLHTHHSTYVRLGNEQHGDLIVLCDECHKLFH